MISISSTRGFTLIEVTFVVILMGILAVFTISNVGNNDDAIRYETTRQKIEALRVAIMGNESSVDVEGKRINFGYFGDIGTLPTALGDLVTLPSGMATWAYSSTYGFARGWHGPYLAATMITGDKGFDKDGWGRTLTYATTGSITSLGSDNAGGGTGFASDLVAQFSTIMRYTSVSGILEDFNARLAGRTVEIAFPAMGVIVSVSNVTDANGYFFFQTVPFGVRSLRVKTSSPQVPRQVVIDRNNFVVPSSLINFFGTLEAVTYVSGSLFRTGTNRNVFASAASTYTSELQIDKITPTWVGGGNITSFKCNGASETFTASASGNQVDLSADFIVPGNSAQNHFELNFDTAPTTGNLSVVITWLNRSRTDTVTIPIP